MPFDAPSNVVKKWRAAYCTGGDDSIFAQVGAFICNFSVVELHITAMLASTLGMHDHERFAFVAKGMDARVKVDRLKSASPRYIAIGPNLTARLDRFKATSIGIRNCIAHSSPFSRDGFIHFVGLGALPDGKHGKATTAPATKISMDNFTRETVWLDHLSQDLSTVAVSTPYMRLPLLEIISPRSNLPKAGHPPILVKAAPAKPRKPVRKPHEK